MSLMKKEMKVKKIKVKTVPKPSKIITYTKEGNPKSKVKDKR